MHDEIQDVIDEQTIELKEKMSKQTHVIVCNIMDLKATVTECCDDLADDIFCTQQLIGAGFEEQAALINQRVL